MVPSFAASISDGFAYVEAPGDETGNYWELAQAAACHIHNLSWLGFSSSWTAFMNVPKCWDAMHVFHHLALVMFCFERVYR